MSLTQQPAFDDQHLVRYLLGLLPEEEAERIDEASVVDDEMAWRLRSVEDDLIDAYVRGTLSDETQRQFQTNYLSSPRRRERVQFAASLIASVDRSAATAAPPSTPTTPATAPQPERVVSRAAPDWRGWALAAALVLASGVLLLQHQRTRSALDAARTENAALDRRLEDLERRLASQPASPSEPVKEPDGARGTLPPRGRSGDGPRASLPALALVLLPQTRGVGQTETLEVPPGADSVRIDLRLEFNDFPRYQATLKDPATNQIIWRTTPVPAQTAADTPTVSITVPASVLKPQHYAVELNGRDATGNTEIVGTYAFQVAR